MGICLLFLYIPLSPSQPNNIAPFVEHTPHAQQSLIVDSVTIVILQVKKLQFREKKKHAQANQRVK